MSASKPKLTISVGEIQVEGDSAVVQSIAESFIDSLRAIRADLNEQGIETTVIVAGVTLDDDLPGESK